MKQNPPFYIENPSSQGWYCLTHRRPATHLFFGIGQEPFVHCAPNFGGIMIVCKCIQKDSPNKPFCEYCGSANVMELDKCYQCIQCCKYWPKDNNFPESIDG